MSSFQTESGQKQNVRQSGCSKMSGAVFPKLRPQGPPSCNALMTVIIRTLHSLMMRGIECVFEQVDT